MKVLLAGASGQVGTEVAALGSPTFRVTACSRAQLDICDAAVVAKAVEQTAPDVVVNCAAYTAVDRAEDEPTLARAANADAVASLAAPCAGRGVPVIHLSTDYVFDGRASRPYREEDPAEPLGVYGETKLAGEQALRQALERHVILRLSWVFGRVGKSFVDTVLRLARERPELTVVDDQIGAPAPAVAVAGAIQRIAGVITAENVPAAAWGTFHFAAAPTLSWCAFAQAIVREGVAAGVLPSAPKVRPIATEDWPTRARRPLNSQLDGAKLERVYGIAPADWRGYLASYLGELAGAANRAEGVPKRSAT